jgi:hypothetical protein
MWYMSAIQPDPSDRDGVSQAKDILKSLALLAVVAAVLGGISSAGTDAVRRHK